MWRCNVLKRSVSVNCDTTARTHTYTRTRMLTQPDNFCCSEWFQSVTESLLNIWCVRKNVKSNPDDSHHSFLCFRAWLLHWSDWPPAPLLSENNWTIKLLLYSRQNSTPVSCITVRIWELKPLLQFPLGSKNVTSEVKSCVRPTHILCSVFVTCIYFIWWKVFIFSNRSIFFTQSFSLCFPALGFLC